MKISKNIWNDRNLIKTFKKGGIVVMPTDTIYGILTSALNKSSVEKLYKIRKRNPDKPCIILLNNISFLEKFNIILSKEQKKILVGFFSAKKPTSIILNSENKKFLYLDRGTKSLSFRIPKQKSLRDLLKKTGPLIAPSANIEGLPPSKNIQEAKNYFGNKVDLYIDGGEIESSPSRVIQLHKDGSISIIRG